MIKSYITGNQRKTSRNYLNYFVNCLYTTNFSDKMDRNDTMTKEAGGMTQENFSAGMPPFSEIFTYC